MALVAIGGSGLPFMPLPGLYPELALVSATLDAAGESCTFIGPLLLSSGIGSSKTISSAGGKIHWLPTTNTFANAGTNFRIGLQDVSATTGLEDGVFDTHDDLVGGTDTITADALHTVVLSSGTKTIAHGAYVAVSFELTARGGADVVRVRAVASNAGNRYLSNDTGSGPGKSSTAFPYVLLEFDDGTVGWFGEGTCPTTDIDLVFNSGSVIDEIANVFTCPFSARVDKLMMILGELDSGEDGEIILYGDALGTPVVIEAIAIDPDLYSQSATAEGYGEYPLTTARDLTAGLTYAVAYRPTTTGNRTLRRITLPTANARLCGPFGANMRQGGRADQTGAFSETTTILPLLGVNFSHFDDGVSAGGGGLLRHPGMTGGING